MSQLEDKFNALQALGWVADPPVRFSPVPVGDGFGEWFGWATAAHVDVAIYSSPLSGVAEVHGAIIAEYRAGGGPLGRLGYPTTDEHDDVDDAGNVTGRVNEFQWGSVSWDRTTYRVTTMYTGPVVQLANVAFQQLLNQGIGLTGRQLGEIGVSTVYGNAVELQFAVQAAAHQLFPKMRPVQWEGPSVTWVKHGSPVIAAWERHRSSLGEGNDGPPAENVAWAADAVAYYDSPGPDVLAFLQSRPSRIRVVQNFTGWVVGAPLGGAGGSALPGGCVVLDRGHHRHGLGLGRRDPVMAALPERLFAGVGRHLGDPRLSLDKQLDDARAVLDAFNVLKLNWCRRRGPPPSRRSLLRVMIRSPRRLPTPTPPPVSPVLWSGQRGRERRYCPTADSRPALAHPAPADAEVFRNFKLTRWASEPTTPWPVPR